MSAENHQRIELYFDLAANICDAIRCHTVIIAIRFRTKYGKHVKTLRLNSENRPLFCLPTTVQLHFVFFFRSFHSLCSLHHAMLMPGTQTNKNRIKVNATERINVLQSDGKHELGKLKTAKPICFSHLLLFCIFHLLQQRFEVVAVCCYCRCRTTAG